MANDFGLSFLPTDQGTGQQPGQGRPGGLGGGLPPVQQAIQLLSLRLPHVFGAQALAPGPLLTSIGGGGMSPGPSGGSLEAILRLLFGLHPGGPGPGPGPLPMPNYTPVPTKPMGWGNARDTWPGAVQPAAPAPSAPLQPTPPTPLPRVTPGVVPRAPMPAPSEAPPPPLPMPNYTPVPTKPMGWGNAPDQWHFHGPRGAAAMPLAAPAPISQGPLWQPTPNDFGNWGI